MRITIGQLREYILSALTEAKDDPVEKIKRNATPDSWRGTTDKLFDNDVTELREQPEFTDVETYIGYKFDNDETTFDATELQALSRNVDFELRGIENALPPAEIVKSIKDELISYGLTFKPREATKHFRGSMSSMAGASRWEGQGGGGSGMFGGQIGIGTAPGAIGGKYVWDANDKKNLSMGSKRK